MKVNVVISLLLMSYSFNAFSYGGEEVLNYTIARPPFDGLLDESWKGGGREAREARPAPKPEKNPVKQKEKESSPTSVTISPDKITDIKFYYGETEHWWSGKIESNYSFKVKIGNQKLILDDDVANRGHKYTESYVKAIALAAATGRALKRNITISMTDAKLDVEGVPNGEFYMRKGQITKITPEGFELWLGSEKTFITMGNAAMLVKLQNALEAVNAGKNKLIKFDYNTSDISVVDGADFYRAPQVAGPKIEIDKKAELFDGPRAVKENTNVPATSIQAPTATKGK